MMRNKMERPEHARALFTAATIVLTTVVAVGGYVISSESAPPPRAASGAPPAPPSQAAPPQPAGTLATIPLSVVAAAEKIANDPQVMALIKDQSTDAAAKARWNQFLELVRIPSPSRQEHLKAAEIHRRLVAEWGFTPAEVMTRNDGVIPASDTNIVDGLPVYNACVVIKGSYSSQPGAQNYKG